MNHLHKMLLATSALVAATVLGSGAQAGGGPSGGKVAVGTATITNPNSTETVVNQTSNAALINWNSFSIPTGSEVLFQQPNKSALTVNRVTGPNASTIDGALFANGNVWLLNANGILFGRGSEVNVGALIATTSDLSDDDFRKGRYRFTKPGSANASVVNQGTITAGPGGSVVLSASQVANQGIIQANLGTVVLGGASQFTVDLDGDNLLRYQITAPVTSAPKTANGNTAAALVSNSGTIEAAGGRVLMTARAAQNVRDDVINNTGHIEATSVSSHNGEIDLDAGPDGTVDAGGTIDASGRSAGETGGAVNITGGTVNVENGATIDASGDAGGGTIQIGGGFHGKGTIANANTTNIGNATISADALVKGDGGQIAIWSDGKTSFAGTVSAKGGAEGGNGGFVETSGGSLSLGTRAKVITSAAKGATGDWLLDPTNIDIVSTGTDGIGGSNISPATLISALGSSNVELEATNDITISSAVDYTSSNTLTMLAEQNITADASIQNAGTGAINLIAGWDGKTTSNFTTTPGAYGNNNGAITIGGASATGNVAVGSAGGTTTLAADSISIEGVTGYAQAGYHGAGGGDLVVDTSSSDVTLLASSANAQIGNGGTDTSGNVGGTITINSGGNVTIDEAANSDFAVIGNISGDTTSSESGDISVTAFGAVTLETEGSGGYSYLGNLSSQTSSGGATGNITVNSGSVVVSAIGAGSNPSGEAVIGDGGNFTNGGTTGGTIDISTGDLSLVAAAPGELAQARIANRGTGSVGGDITITASGNVVLSVEDTNLAAIGNASLNDGTTGTIDVQAGGTVTLSALDSGEARIANNFDADGDVTVTAGGNITLSVAPGTDNKTGGQAFIGNFGNGTMPAGGDVTVTSTSGDISLTAGESNALVVIGNTGGTTATGGTVTVSAADATNGTIDLNASGTGSTVEIGNVSGSGPSSGNIFVTSGVDLDLSAGGDNSLVQIGNGGVASTGASGEITVSVGGNLNQTADGSLAIAQIGNGTLLTGSSATTGNISGDISIDVTGTLTINAGEGTGTAWIGNSAGTGFVESGNVTIITGSVNSSSGFGTNMTTDLGSTSVPGSGGNVMIGQTSSDFQIDNNGASVDSPNNITFLDTGNIDIEIPVINSGTGNITLVAGWDGKTMNPADLTNAGVYGNNGGSITIGGTGASGDVSIGTAGGTLTLAGSNLTIEADYGYAQAGYHGAGTGNIVVDLTGNLTLNSYDGASEFAQLGNGSVGGDVSGNISGDITANVGGSSTFNVGEGGGTAWLGNYAAAGYTETGNVTLLTNSGYVPGNWLTGDLGSTPGTGGNVFIGFTGTESITVGGLSYSSSNNFTWASVGDLTVDETIQNSGTGALTLIQGWDGKTTNLANLTNAGVYGASGTFTVGGDGGEGNVSVGSAGGTTTILGDNLVVEGDLGYAQVGYHGAATGNIVVDLTGSLTLNSLNSTSDYAQIGNGSLNNDVSGNVSGDITINAPGGTTLNTGEGVGNSWLGNATGEGIASGNVSITTGSLTNNGYADFGANIEADLGSSSSPGSGGNVTIGITNDDINIGTNGLAYDSPNNLELLSEGNFLTAGSILNSGSGNITLIAGWNPAVDPSAVLTTPGAYGNNNAVAEIVAGSGNVAIGSMTGTTTVAGANVFLYAENGSAQIGFPGGGGSGTIDVYATGTSAPAYNQDSSACFGGDGNICLLSGTSAGDYVQIGNGGYGETGTSSGNINVTATNDIVLVGGGATIDGQTQTVTPGSTVDAYAMIGNGDASGADTPTVGGNVYISAGGETYMAAGSDPTSPVWLGNYSGTGGNVSGNFTFITGSETDNGGSSGTGDVVGQFVTNALTGNDGAGAGGDVVIGFTEPGSTLKINHDYDFSTSNSLTILSVDSIEFTGEIQNSGTGDVTLVAGWDGTTLGTPAQIEAADAYGLNSGSVVVGGTTATGKSSFGSAGGTTTVLGDTVTVDAYNAGAHIGFSGAATGAIDVVALGDVTVEALNIGQVAEIGNGGRSTTGNAGGAINVSSGGDVLVEVGASDPGGIAMIGNLGSGSESGDISVITQGGSVTVESLANAGTSYATQAFIGNASVDDTDGGATGNITINSGAGAVDITASGNAAQAWIGDGGIFTSSGATGGNIDITAGSLSLEANGPNEPTAGIAEALIGNQGLGTVDGTIQIETAGNVDLDATNLNWAVIGNSTGLGGSLSGDITVNAGGNVSLTAEQAGTSRISAGNAADTNIDVTAGGNILLSVTGTPPESSPVVGSVIIGNTGTASTGGNTTVTSTGGNIQLDAVENGSDVSIGNTEDNSYSGGDSGTIQVSAMSSTNGYVELDASGTNSIVQIGNGGSNVGGDAGGAISVASGGQVTVEASAAGGIAAIGNISTGSQSGDISVITQGGSVSIDSLGNPGESGDEAQAFIGNASLTSTNGGATGNITINTGVGAVDLTGSGNNAQAWIGDGGIFTSSATTGGVGDGAVFTSSGATGGNISITSGSLSLEADEGNANSSEARVVNRGNGTVTGTIDITTTGDVDLDATNLNLAAIGNAVGGDGSSSGNITIDAGGNISLTSEAGGFTRVAAGNPTATNIDITAGGNILLTVTGTPVNNGAGSATIGNFGIGPTGGDITVTSTGGNIQLNAVETDSYVFIGNDENGVSGANSGNITVSATSTANGFVQLDASGTGAYVQIGNGVATGAGSATGNISVTGADGVTLEAVANSAQAQIGNGGYQFAGDTSGSVSVTGSYVDVSATAASTIAQIGNGGDASVGNTGGAVSIASTTGDITFTDNGSNTYIQIGDGGVNFQGDASGSSSGIASGSVTLTSAGNVKGSVTGSGILQIGSGGSSSVGSAGGDITIMATGDLDLTTATGSSGGTGIMVGNGGFFSNMAAANGFTDSGDIKIDANNITLEAKNSQSIVEIGNGGHCAGANGAAATSYCGTSATGVTTNGDSGFEGDITINAATSLNMLADQTSQAVWIGNGGDGAAYGMNVTNNLSDGMLSVYGNIDITVGSSSVAGSVLMQTGTPGNSDVHIGDGGFNFGNQATATGDIDGIGNVTLDVLGGSDHGGSLVLNAQGTTVSGVTIGDVSTQLTAGGIGGETNVNDDGTIALSGVTGVSLASIETAVGGTVTINASSIATSGPAEIAGGGADITVAGAGGAVGESSDPLLIDVNDLTIQTNNGNVYLNSPSQGLTFDGVNLGTGTLFLTAGGPIAQFAVTDAEAIVAAGIDISTTTGAIELGNGANVIGTVTLSTSGDAGLNDTVNLTVAGANVGGTLTLNGSGTVGQTGAITANTLDVTTTTGSITLANTGNAIGTASITTGGSATLDDSSSLTISGADVTGTLTLDGASTIGQTGAITAGTLDVTTTTGAIDLDSDTNAFSTLTVSTGSATNATFADNSNLTIASASVGGTLTISGDGNIGQSGTITANTLDVGTAAGNITLSNNANAIGTASISAPGYEATLYDSTGLVISDATVSGTLTLSTGGAVTQTGAISAGGIDVTTGAGAITLTNAGNLIGKASLSTSGSNNASLTDAGGLTILGATVGGTLTLTGTSTIEGAGAIVANTLDVSSTGGAIDLSNTADAFDTLTVATPYSTNATIADSSNLTVANANVGGTLTLDGTGTIGQSGAIVANALDITTAGGNVTLTNSGNTFNDTSITVPDSGNVSLTDSEGLTIVGTSVGGTLTVTASGDIGESGTLGVGTLNATSTGGSIDLGGTGNTIGSASLTTSGSNNATLYDASNLTITGGDVGGTLTLTGGGTIGQSGAFTASALDVTTAATAINLGNTGNSVGTATITTSNENATLGDASNLTIASANVGNGTLTINGSGTIGQSGAISAGGLDVSSTGGTITLTNTGNAIGAASLSTSGSSDATLYDSSNLTITGGDVGGTLTLTGGGSIGQSGAFTASILDATTTDGAIDLGNTGNAVGTATISTSGSDNATLDDTSNLTIADANVGSGTLTINGGGTVGQSGAITAGALDASSTGSAITLTNTGNAFSSADLSTSGSNNASLFDASDLTITGGNVGGTLTLTGGGSIGQSGAISANALDVTTTEGAITLANTSNTIGTATLSTSGSDNATLDDASNLTIAGATVGGTLTIAGGGTIGQSGGITANTLDVSSTGGAINLDNAGNAFGTATISTAGEGTNNATLGDASNLTIALATVGEGTLTINGGGTVGQSGAITAGALYVSSTGGAITLTNTENALGSASLSTSGSNNASLYDASDLTISGGNVGGTLTLTGGGTIGQSGAFTANTLDVTTTEGAITLGNSENSIGTATLNTSGSDNATLADASALTIAGANVGSGTLTINGGSSVGQLDPITAAVLAVSSTGGAITLTDPNNAVGSVSLNTSGSNAATFYDTVNLTVTSASVGGDLEILTTQNLTFVGNAQSLNGTLLAVAGWDGETTDPSSLVTGNAYGNNSGSITIGGSGADGGVSVGAANGATTLAADNVSLDATNGFAQVGVAVGSNDISVDAKGNVALTAGGGSDQFAQIGNGGADTSGNESGDISVSASGNVVLAGGAGNEDYAQIGHGGAESNSNSESYSDTGAITVSGQTVALTAGQGTGSYAQIGHGGYLSGQNLSGTATIGGQDINVTGANGVSLTGGGQDAYAQIGNGGDLVNSNAKNGANGTISGAIDVTVSNTADQVTETGGSGTDSYAQIGNGGKGENTPASGATVNFNVSGNVTVSDLALTGSDTGTDGYTQVGNGDASKTGYANVSGNIDISSGDITVDSGTADGATAMIGNATGVGSVSGTITGYTPPGENTTTPASNGAVATTENTTITPTDTSVQIVTVTPENTSDQNNNTPSPNVPQPTPLDQLANNGQGGTNSEGNDSTDDLTSDLSQSLDPGSNHKIATVTTKSIIPGVLSELVVASLDAPHGVPPADEDYSSWGNEALWQW